MRSWREAQFTAVALCFLVLPVTLSAFKSGMSFDVTPSSAQDPITAKAFDVTSVVNAPPGTDWLLLETVAGPRFSGLPFWFPLDTQSDSTSVDYWSEYFDRNDEAHDPVDPAHPSTNGGDVGQFSVILSAWKGRNGTWLANASHPAVVHFDKSYTKLRWDISASARGVPGTVRMTLSAADDDSVKLAPQTRYAWWFRYKYTTTPKSGIAQFAEDTTIEMSLEPPTFDLSLSLPGIYYLGIFGSFSKGVSRGQPQGASGFVSQRAPLTTLSATETVFQPFALIIPFANGTTPALPPGFKGKSLLLPSIPGNIRFALQPSEQDSYTKITMFDGGAVSLRLLYPDSTRKIQFIELELPSCIVAQNVSRNYKYRVVPAPSQPPVESSDAGRYRVRLLPTPTGGWSSDQRVLWLLPKISCTTGQQMMKVRPLLTEAFSLVSDNWQQLMVKVVPTPTPLASPPKRLAPSLTWAPAYHFAPNETAEGLLHSVRMFRNVGMTTIPQSGCRELQPSSASGGRLFTPEERQTEIWTGLQYGPQISSFYQSFNGIGMFQALVMNEEKMNTFNPTKMMQSYGLSSSQITAELSLLSNALDFHNKTGRIDVAYDGFFFANDLNVTNQVVSWTKPEYWFVDSELFTPWEEWLADVSLSRNAETRRRPGEGDAELAYRMSNEFMTRYNQTVFNASGGKTAVGLFGAHATGGGGVGSFPWSILGDLGQLSQPGWYGQHNTANLQSMVDALQAEKRALGHGPQASRLIPWLTVDTSGPTTPTSCFDELVHVFLNGASGFSYYADIDFHDMEYYVRIAEVMALVTPFEDLIVDGQIVPLAGATNCIVSAMTLDGVYLLGVTPIDTDQSVSWTLQTNATGEHALRDVARDAVVKTTVGGEVSLLTRITQTTVYSYGLMS